MYSGKKAQHDFPKMRGGGIKGRLELFQKFITFGDATLPLVLKQLFKPSDFEKSKSLCYKDNGMEAPQ